MLIMRKSMLFIFAAERSAHLLLYQWLQAKEESCPPSQSNQTEEEEKESKLSKIAFKRARKKEKNRNSQIEDDPMQGQVPNQPTTNKNRQNDQPVVTLAKRLKDVHGEQCAEQTPKQKQKRHAALFRDS